MPDVPLEIIDVDPRYFKLNVTGDVGDGAELMVNVRVAVPVPALFVALNVTVDVPAFAGVPEINPLVVLTDKPDGRPVAP